MTRHVVLAGCLALVCSLHRSARADDAIRFTSLAPDGGRSELTARTGFHHLEDAAALYSLQLDAQYVWPIQLGAYLRAAGGSDGDTTDLGSVELGGLYHLGRGPYAITFRGGVAVPTRDAPGGHANSTAVLMTRPSDARTSRGDLTVVRAAFAPTVHVGPLVVRADVGLELPSRYGAYGHYDLAVGAVHRGVAVTAELATQVDLMVDDPGSNETHHAISFGAQYALDATALGATFSLPFVTGGVSEGPQGYSILVAVSRGL